MGQCPIFTPWYMFLYGVKMVHKKVIDYSQVKSTKLPCKNIFIFRIDLVSEAVVHARGVLCKKGAEFDRTSGNFTKIIHLWITYIIRKKSQNVCLKYTSHHYPIVSNQSRVIVGLSHQYPKIDIFRRGNDGMPYFLVYLHQKQSSK